MLPIMPPHFMNSSRNGIHHETTSNSTEKDNFFKIEHILNRTATLDTNRINKKHKQQQQQQQQQLLQKNIEKLNIGVYSGEKIQKDSITCNITSDELIKNCANRKIKVKISNSDGYIRSISFKSDTSWIRCIQLAKDIHSNNVLLELIDNSSIRLRAVEDIEENEELIMWFSEEISILMNIPFLTPINIRGNNCYTCHNCKSSFEYPNYLKIHLATLCSQESIDTIWKKFSYTINKSISPQAIVQNNNKKPQMIPQSLSEPTSTSISATLLYSKTNHLVLKSQSDLYQHDRQSAFKPITPPPLLLYKPQQPQRLPLPPPPPPSSLSSSSSTPSISTSGNTYIPSHSFLLHNQYSICNYQHTPIVNKSSPLHRTLFSSASCFPSTTITPSSNSLYSTSSISNSLLTTSLTSSSSSTSSSSPSLLSLPYHRQITSTTSASAVAAAALNAAAQIETIVSNMGASKQGHLCIYCGKLYSRKYGLKIHIRTHTGFKPLKCKYCFRPFGDPSNLNKHVRLHMQSGNLSFRCHLCNKTLARRRDLQKHIETRHCIVTDDDSTPFTIST